MAEALPMRKRVHGTPHGDRARASSVHPMLNGGIPAEAAQGLANDAIAMIELLFFAYRDFTAESDRLLAELDFGRAHHRVLHFVNRNPGLRVADLLSILKITKQSLARVLKQLIEDGYIEQHAGEADRRERLLFTSSAGRALAERLMAPQIQRITAAAADAVGEGADAVESFLVAMIDQGDRAKVAEMIRSQQPRVTSRAEPER